MTSIVTPMTYTRCLFWRNRHQLWPRKKWSVILLKGMFQGFMGCKQYRRGQIRTRVGISFKCLQSYTLAVIENGYAAWDKIHEKSAQQGQDEDSTWDGDRNTRTVKGKYTSHSGSKRQYSHLGWSQDGMNFYNRVKMGWKKLSCKNVNNVWTELEDEWMSFMKEIN